MMQEHKIYVQYRMIEQGATLWNLINAQKASIFVAGFVEMQFTNSLISIDQPFPPSNSTRMPTDVRAAIVEVIITHGKVTEDEAKAYVEDLDRTGRLQMETWA